MLRRNLTSFVIGIIKLTLDKTYVQTPRCRLCSRYGSVICSTKVAHNLAAVCRLDCGFMPLATLRLGCRWAVADLYDSNHAPVRCRVPCLQVGVLTSVSLCLMKLTPSEIGFITKNDSGLMYKCHSFYGGRRFVYSYQYFRKSVETNTQVHSTFPQCPFHITFNLHLRLPSDLSTSYYQNKNPYTFLSSRLILQYRPFRCFISLPL
jgi:hypothetical protein